MTTAGEVIVNVSGRDVNLVALLNRLDASLRATDQAGLKLTQTVGTTFTAAQQKAANAAITEAQALASAARAAGDDARAHQILVGALGNSAAATDRSVAGLTTSINRLQSGAGIAQQFGAAMKSSLLGIIGPAALASAAIAGIGTVIRATEDAFKLKASLDATTFAIKAQLVGLRDSNAVFAEGQFFASKYKLTQQELTDALQTSISVMRVSNASTTDILNTFARLTTLAPDKTISDAARAVRELAAGDVTSIKELFNVSAENAHRMKLEIQQGGDAIQVITKFLDQANIGMAGMEAKATGAAGAMRELAQANERFSLALAGQSGGLGLTLLETRTKATSDATRVLEGDVLGLNTILADLGPITGVIGAMAAYNEAVFGAGRSTLEWAGAIEPAATAEDGLVAATAAATAAIQAGIPVVDAHAQAVAHLRDEHLVGGEAATNAARMIEVAANASLLDTQAKQLETLQTQLLNQETLNTANAFLAANPQIDAAGIRAAILAGVLPRVAGELAIVNQQIASTRAELAALKGGGGGPGLSATSFLESQRFANKNAREAAAAAAAAQRDQTIAVGLTADKMALLNRQLAEAKRNYGEGSAQAIRAQTAIDQAVDRSSKKVKGAGAVRLSDQQKLHNSLLADQEKFQDQSEEAARQHGRRVLEIEEDYAKKSLAQMRKNELSKRQSEIDFLKALTSSELNATKEGRAELARIDAQYYADFDAAQKAAQAGNAEQSERMAEQARHRADVELEYAEKIAEARKNKDTGEVERLQALLEKERQLLDEQQKQILEGGDANVQARNEALSEEERRYAEQQGKIGTSAENAAERKVNAAVRSGKAVEAENVALREQEAIIDRIGTRSPGAPGVPAGPSPPTVPGSANAPVVAAPIDGGAIVAAIERSIAVLESIRRAVQQSAADTTGAIGRIGPRLSGA